LFIIKSRICHNIGSAELELLLFFRGGAWIVG